MTQVQSALVASSAAVTLFSPELLALERAERTLFQMPSVERTYSRINAALHCLLDVVAKPDRDPADQDGAKRVLRARNLLLKGQNQHLIGGKAQMRFWSIMPPRRREDAAAVSEAKKQRHLQNLAARKALSKERVAKSGGGGNTKVVTPTNPKAIKRREKKLAAAAALAKKKH